MYRNDNDKKYALLALIFVMIIFTLVSCGKEMRALRGDAHEIAWQIYERAGIDARGMEEKELTELECYMLGIDEESFGKKVEEAKIFRPDALSSGQSLCIVVAKSDYFAEEIFGEMQKNFEWAPCDPAENAVFMQYGKYVILGKDSAEGARAFSEAFAAETDGRAKTMFSQNPM